jgi:hypothetical protein
VSFRPKFDFVGLAVALIVAAPGVADARDHGGHSASHRGHSRSRHHSLNWTIKHLFS